MKITVDARMWGHSGIGVYLQNLLPHMTDLRPNAEWTLIGEPQKISASNPSFFTRINQISSSTPIYSLREQWEIPRLTPSETDLLWIPHYNYPMSYRGAMVVTVHDVLPLARADMFGDVIKTFYANLFFRLLPYRASGIITVSDFTRSELLRYMAGNPDVFKRVHNGVDQSWFEAGDDAPPFDPPYFVYVGNVKPHKNLTTLLEVFKSITEDIPHRLLLVGETEGFRTADPKALRKGQTLKNAQFTGKLSREDLQSTVAAAEALIFPSLYEGFGLPPLEAMAAGTPVIGARIDPVVEVCGDVPFYFDPTSERDLARTLRKFLQDPGELENRIIRGKQRARKFSWETSAKKTLAVFDEVIEAEKQ